MKYFSAFLFSFAAATLNGSAWADRPVEPVEPSKVCDHMGSVSGTRECESLVNGADWIDKLACGVCDRLSTDDRSLACMKAARNGTFQREALFVCNGISRNATIVECVETIRGRKYTSKQLRECDSTAIDPDTVKCLAEQRN